jgi:intein-encoded DNA endonuclease-like protein
MLKDKQMINSKFFKEWSSNMAYILGFIVADGCVMKRKGRGDSFILNITTKDKKHLLKIQKAMRSNYQIGLKSRGGSSEKLYSFVQISNKEICLDLISLGVVPRKTYNLKTMDIPDEFFSDFTRGFLDGDGTVYIYKVNGTPQIKGGFVSPSLSFITEFNKQLCEAIDISCKAVHKFHSKNKNLPLYTICFYVDDCEKLTNFIYRNNSVLYLPRKRKIFEKWKSIKRRDYIKQNYPSKIGWQLNRTLYSSSS